MSLTGGTRLGPYEIHAPLGAGGMGDVYRATDTRLHRDVAIKVMANRWRDRPDLRARFRLEAESIAALSHPHICQLYDVGEQDGFEYLVMELVEGQTLADRLTRGRLRLDQALPIARAIADALDAAHRRGIVHRDLKPANVMLTPGGVKLLDFGLARLRVPDHDAVAGASTVAAHDTRLTETGAALGTWRYMAPEQIRGGEADARSDIFAFGAVFYEMLTGRHAFEAASHRELVTAILETDPPSLSPDFPPPVAYIIRACLEKPPDDRWQSAGDARRALDAVQSTGAIDVLGGVKRVVRPWMMALAAALVVAVAAAGGLLARFTAPTGAAVTRVVRSTIPLTPLPFPAAAGPFVELAFAPDGRSFVYGYLSGQKPLYRRALDEASGVPIPGTENGQAPFFSPDGQWIGFVSGNRLMKVAATGGGPLPICDVGQITGASWGEDGSIVVGSKSESGLLRVAASGGVLEPFTTLAPEDAGNEHRFPQVLPGGRGLLFAVGTGPDADARIVVLDLRSGTRKDLVRGSISARYVETGDLVYAREGDLFAVPFDLDRLETSGRPVRIASGVAENDDGVPEYAFSPQGDLVYVPGPPCCAHTRPAFGDLQGTVESLPLPRRFYSHPRVSPDGSRIAFTVVGTKNDVWVYDVSRKNATRVTFGRYNNPVWTPDGRLTLAQGGLGNTRIVARSADGTGTDEEIIPAQTDLKHRHQVPLAWTPDGRTLIFDRGGDLWTVSPGVRTAVPFVESPFNDSFASISPDGKWLAYSSTETGRGEVYVRPLAGAGRRVQVSVSGATRSVWSPDGRRLYFHGPRASSGPADSIWAVEITTVPTLSATPPRLMFTNAGLTRAFDITPDGKRFVMVQQDNTPPPQELHLVLNALQPR
jgi:serine/threonine-protein kinase